MIKEILKITGARVTIFLVCLIIIEQLSVATGTFFLAESARNVANPKLLLWLVVAYFLVSQVPNATLILIKKFEAQGFLDMYSKFIERRLWPMRGHAAIWTAKSKKDIFSASVGPEAETYISAVGFCYLDLLTYFLNILFSSVALSLVLDKSYLWLFMVSAFLSGCVYKVLNRRLETTLESEQRAKLELFSTVGRFWDNWLLPNKSIHERYQSTFYARFKSTRFLTGKSAAQAGLLVFWLSTASFLPIFLFVIQFVIANLSKPELLAALLVTLPPQMVTLKTFNQLFQLLANLKVFSKRLKSVMGNTELDPVDLNSLIDFRKIKINGKVQSSTECIFEEILKERNGRVLIEGTNGAGKSSLLLSLSQKVETCFYLPPNGDLMISDPSQVESSTGERVLAHIRYIWDNPTPVVLLDEWDANLDLKNRQEISDILDQLSTRSLVVEIRH